jgi:zinc metalloprotease ZmpB
MNQEFDSSRNLYFDRDIQGVVRQLLHTHAPISIQAHTPQLAAEKYLSEFGELLGLTPSQLKNMSSSPSDTIEDAPIEYRFLDEKRQFDTATVAYYQTDLGLPVFQAGVAVQMKMAPFRILSSQSTMHPDLNVKVPSKSKAKQAESLNEEELARLLGLTGQKKNGFRPDQSSLRLKGADWLFIATKANSERSALGPRHLLGPKREPPTPWSRTRF